MQNVSPATPEQSATPDGGPVRPWVTIVSGAPRSGTSMTMRMLEQGGLEPLVDDVRVADPDNPRGYYEFEPVKRLPDDVSWLPGAEGRVVKMVYALLRCLPLDRDYRVLMMRRDLDEVLRSQRKMLERLGRPPLKMPPEKARAMFAAHLAQTEQWLTAEARFRWMRVDYNDVLREPAPTIDGIDAFLGGGLDTAAMAAVVEPALYRNRS